MKKTLLVICFFGFTFGFSQINTSVSSITVCDTNNDGIASFNLSNKIPEILGNLNPSTNIVTFHITLLDSQVGVNPISNSTNFINNTPFSQILYVRVNDVVNNQINLTNFVLNVVSPPNAGTDGQITVCETNPNVINLYSIITGEQPGGIWSRIAGVGGTLNVFAGTFTPSIGMTSSVFAYIINGSLPCQSDSSTATITIVNQNNCNPSSCLVPNNLSASNLSSNAVNLSWTETGSATSWEVLIVPFGSPQPSITQIGSISSSNNYTVTNLTPNECYTSYVRSVCSLSAGITSAWSQPVSFCTTDCTNNGLCSSNLSLIAFLDSNNNGIKDTDETVFNNGNFLYTINNGSTQYYGYSNSGNYSIFSNNPSNSYNLSFVLNSNLVGYYNSNATFNNISIAANSGVTEYFFPISVLQVYNDLEVQLIANNNPIPGFTYSNTIIYKNNGAQNINSGTLTFTKDNNVILNSISQSGTSALSNGFSYSFTNLAPFEQRSIYIEMQVPTIPTISLGTLLTNSVTIEPLSDVIPTNNSSSLTQIVIGSYDPNDKTESHGEKIVVSNFSSNDYLTYTIRFENTGTANTQFIRIEDLLDSSLNANSVEVLNASHPFNFRRENNKLIWNFYAISLPPTSINNQLSQGFVQFKVKPNSGYSIGDVIPNFANIYFDYNPAIITNTFNTEFVSALANANFNTGDFNLFPNPATNSVQIKLFNDNSSLKNIVIYDMIGKSIKSISNLNSNETIVDISTFSKGMYLVEITNDNLLKEVKKLIVE